MKDISVEALDKSRYSAMLWATIGWGAWYGANILKDTALDNTVIGILSVIGTFSLVIWLIGLLKMNKLNKILKVDKVLSNALNDEVVMHNRLKSFQIGFWSFGITTACCLYGSNFLVLSAEIVCEIILYFGVLSSLVAWLIYNKN